MLITAVWVWDIVPEQRDSVTTESKGTTLGRSSVLKAADSSHCCGIYGIKTLHRLEKATNNLARKRVFTLIDTQQISF